MTKPTDPSNPADVTTDAAERLPDPGVTLFSDGPFDNHHFTAWQTTVTKHGYLEVEPAIVGSGWHVQNFNENSQRDFGAGIWVMFERPFTFKAGDGVFLTPAMAMRGPRLKVNC